MLGTAGDFEKIQIYEMDGLHGTLKELCNYFKVDPIEVSDKLLDGMNIETAILTSDTIKTEFIEKKPANLECVGVLEKKPIIDKIKNSRKDSFIEKKPIDMVNSDDAIKTKVSESLSETETNTIVKDFGDYYLVVTTTTTVIKKGN